MRMNTKKHLVMLGVFCAAATFSLAVSSFNNEVVKADTATPIGSGFYMEEGAKVRTTADELGIRFGATITKEYWETLQATYGVDATYSFYSVVTDDINPITKNYGTTIPNFVEKDTYTFYSTIVYTTEELELAGLLDEACELELSAQTYVNVTKAGETETITIAANGETGKRSMKAVANAAVLAGEKDEDLAKYFEEGNRSEKVEGYSFTDKSGGVVTMAALNNVTETTDFEVYYGAQKVDATYENGTISFGEIAFKAENPYLSVFTGGKVYSTKVTEALKITQANVTSLQSVAANATIYLAENVSLEGVAWSSTVRFTGVFDGGNHVIDNLTTATNGGFFQYIDTGSIVKNVAFTNVTMGSNSGVLAYQVPNSGVAKAENVFIQVKKTGNSTTSSRYGIVERTNTGSLDLTKVVLKMPGVSPNETVLGHNTKSRCTLINVYWISVGPSNKIAMGTSVVPAQHNCGAYANVEAFNGATKTLTSFLTNCVTTYLNNAQ